MNFSKKIETKTATLFIENDIMYTLYKEGSDVHLKDIEENFNVRLKFQQGKKIRILVDVKDVWQFSERARKFAGSDQLSDITIAMAVLIGSSMPVMIIANFFMKFNKPKTPTKLFKSEKKSLEWLENYK